MAKILVAECKQESSSFNPVPSHYQDFSIAVGPEVLRRHAGVGSEMAGALGVFATQPDVQVVPAYSARAITSGGVLAAADFDRIAREFLDAVRSAPPVDAVYFSLHGAMEAQNEHDTEGFLLAETRKILGERIPIVVSLDLHGILTDRMLQHADAVAMYHTYPHVDFFQTGERAARLLLRILAGAVRPVTAAVTIPALVRGNELITATGLLGTFVRQAQAIEASPGGLAAGMFIGNPFTDVPGLCSRSVVVTDNDPARAEREALALAEGFWAVRERLQQPLTSLAEAVRIAAQTEGTTILTDAADATSSGAPGDSNAILRALVESGYPKRVLAPVVDPPAVRAAFAAGVGHTLTTEVGGALDPKRHRPLPITRHGAPALGRPLPERVPRRHLAGGADGSPGGALLHPGRDQSRREPLRPLALPGPWAGPGALRRRRGEIPALPGALLPGLGDAAGQRGCAGGNVRQPEEPRPHPLPAAHLPPGCQRGVPTSGQALLANVTEERRRACVSTTNGKVKTSKIAAARAADEVSASAGAPGSARSSWRWRRATSSASIRP